jgi:integrase
MATVSYRNGRAEVRFYDQSGIRRQVALGEIPKRVAESAANHIQDLVNSSIGGLSANAENVVWASKQRPRIVSYLAELGLIPKPEKTEEPAPEPVKVVPTVDEWFSRYIQNRPGSDGSRKVWNRAKQQAVKFFGADRPIDAITSGDAVDYFESMQRGKGKLAATTSRKMIGVARQVFKRALKAGHITANPFHDDELPTSISDREKQYIDLPTIQSVLSVLPSAEWRAVIIFARFAGMRVQSELPLLKWSDIDEQENRFAVYSPKTKRTRRVPLFPEIRTALDDLRPITGDSEFVLRSLREKSNNWRTPLEKMLKRAGITSWSPLFNCLRSSAEIDIARRFGVVAATEWVGNSVQVAMKHYLRTTADDFKRASDFAPKDAPVTAQTEANRQEVCTHDAPMPATENPVNHGKPNKKRAFEENSEARSMDDIGLETNGRSLSPQTTCEHEAEWSEVIAPKDAPVERFIIELKSLGFDADQIRLVSVAMSRAGVMIEDMPGGMDSDFWRRREAETPSSPLYTNGDSTYPGGIVFGRGASGGDR